MLFLQNSLDDYGHLKQKPKAEMPTASPAADFPEPVKAAAMSSPIAAIRSAKPSADPVAVEEPASEDVAVADKAAASSVGAAGGAGDGGGKAEDKPVSVQKDVTEVDGKGKAAPAQEGVDADADDGQEHEGKEEEQEKELTIVRRLKKRVNVASQPPPRVASPPPLCIKTSPSEEEGKGFESLLESENFMPPMFPGRGAEKELESPCAARSLLVEGTGSISSGEWQKALWNGLREAQHAEPEAGGGLGGSVDAAGGGKDAGEDVEARREAVSPYVGKQVCEQNSASPTEEVSAGAEVVHSQSTPSDCSQPGGDKAIRFGGDSESKSAEQVEPVAEAKSQEAHNAEGSTPESPQMVKIRKGRQRPLSQQKADPSGTCFVAILAIQGIP